MKDAKDTPKLKSVAKLMTQIGLMEAELNGGKKDKDYFERIENVALGMFRVVVMGEIKKGKSSFINALCATKDLVPVHDDVATSTIFEIKYGETPSYTVYFKPETQKEKLVISAEELNHYGTESGNPDNRQKVDYIELTSPSLLLKEGILLIDTPGVGGLFKKHREITFQYAPKANAVFFVTDSIESPIGADEISFLKELRKFTALIYFVQTKGADVDADTRKRRKENNISILTEQAGFKKEVIKYFIVDSNMKLDADATSNSEDMEYSGFIPLMTYLNNELKPAQDSNIVSTALSRSWPKFTEICDRFLQRKNILEAETKEKQDDIRAEIDIAEDQLNDMKRNVWPNLIRDFRIKIQNIKTEISSRAAQCLRPGGELSEEAGRIISSYSEAQPEEIYRLAEPLANETRGRASELMLQVSNDLTGKFTILLEELAHEVGSGIKSSKRIVGYSDNENTQIQYSNAQLEELKLKCIDPSLFEKARVGLYGGMAGGILAGVAGGIIGSVIPVFGTLIGSSIGVMIATYWGGTQAAELDRSQKASQARQQVFSFVQNDLAFIHTQVQEGLSKAFNSLQIKAEDALKELIQNASDRMTSAKDEVNKRSDATAQEINESKQYLTNLESRITEIRNELTTMENMLK